MEPEEEAQNHGLHSAVLHGEEKDTTQNAHETHFEDDTHTNTHAASLSLIQSTMFCIRSSVRLIRGIWLVGDVWRYIEKQKI